MIVLWITNLPLPDAQEALFHTKQSKEGWLVQLAILLSSSPGISLYIASRVPGLKEERQFEIGNIHYYCFPGTYVNGVEMQEYWKRCYSSIKPDIVHIQGTECNHSVQFVMAYPNAKTVVSIQGLVSVISRYYYGGIPEKVLQKYQSLYRRIKGISMTRCYQSMCKAAESEKYIIQHVKYVIGRTEWDKNHVFLINPNIEYYIGNETMRPMFYTNRWTYEKCDPHTIFVTQGLVPYKGFHQVLKSMAIVKKTFPDVKLRVALVPEIKAPLRWRSRIMAGEYQMYLRNLVKQFDLIDNIEVLGVLSEAEMVSAMLSSNIFVSPSAIENSPNSLCEAQLLGMPAVASYVGGTPTIADDGKATKLYRYEEYDMLASHILMVFNGLLDTKQLNYARDLALTRNNATRNVVDLINIYKEIYAK